MFKRASRSAVCSLLPLASAASTCTAALPAATRLAAVGHDAALLLALEVRQASSTLLLGWWWGRGGLWHAVRAAEDTADAADMLRCMQHAIGA